MFHLFLIALNLFPSLANAETATTTPSTIEFAIAPPAPAENLPVAATEVVKSEAEACAESLSAIYNSGLTERMQKIVWDDQSIDRAIQKMREDGLIRSDAEAALRRAQLALGAVFGQQGLMSEAVYQTFKDRFKSKSEIRDALGSFRYLSSSQDQAVLIGEVIERVLQYVPDIDTNNLNRVKETAAFLGMSEDQLASFREKWLVYDSADEFVQLLQGGVLAQLASADDMFVDQIVARSKFFNSLFRLRKTINIPPRPGVVNAKLERRDIEVNNLTYYPDDELKAYLQNSSSAARRYFILFRMSYFTSDQLKYIFENKQAFWLKQSLVATLSKVIAWREALRPKFRAHDDLRKQRDSLNLAIARIENRQPYNSGEVLKDTGLLQRSANATEARERAVEMLHKMADRSDPFQYVGLIVSIVNSAHRSLQGDRENTLAVIRAAVEGSMAVGLNKDQYGKVLNMLKELGGRLAGRGTIDANNVLMGLRETDLNYFGKPIEFLREELAKVEPQLAAAFTELEAAYDRRP